MHISKCAFTEYVMRMYLTCFCYIWHKICANYTLLLSQKTQMVQQ